MSEQTKDENIIQEEIAEKKPFKRYIFGALIILLSVGLIFFIHDQLQYESTDDAYIETTTVQVAPKVSGQIAEIFITDNQRIEEGTIVAKIDDADYKIKVEQAKAKYEKALSNQKNAKANHSAAKTDISVAKADLDRYKNLYEEGAVSKQTLDSAQAKYDTISAKLVTAEESLLSKEGTKVADAEIREIKAMLEQAELNLSYTEIKAPQSGTVSNRRVEKGMYVQVGAPLFVIVPDNIWILANYKENQLRHIKPGQDVDIKIDTYGKKIFKGKVDSIQRSSGAKSSLFPPENAVGSFVKIVQRIPVKIIFAEDINPEEYNIIPGMSVVPKVRIK